MRTIHLCLAVVLSVLFSRTAPGASCEGPQTGTKQFPALSPPLSEVVVGQGRLQFYSAPNLACAMPGIFVIPKDELIAYAQSDDGWTFVMYANPGTGNTVQGWVRSVRLNQTGAVGPRQ